MASETKWTGGTWRAVDLRHQKNGQIRIWADRCPAGDSAHLANVLSHGSHPDADAALMCAAPEMYAALAEAVKDAEEELVFCGNCGQGEEYGSREWVKHARAALAKARGEEP